MHLYSKAALLTRKLPQDGVIPTNKNTTVLHDVIVGNVCCVMFWAWSAVLHQAAEAQDGPEGVLKVKSQGSTVLDYNKFAFKECKTSSVELECQGNKTLYYDIAWVLNTRLSPARE